MVMKRGTREAGRIPAPGVILALSLFAPSAGAQMHMHMPMPADAVLGIADARAGSGTSWLPDAAPMHAAHHRAGAWILMLHGAAFLQYDNQGGARGADQVALIDWGMLDASRALAGGRLGLRGMASSEPWTVGAHGYPLLLQSGESYRGAPLHDRQHPHDLFVELAALYARPVTRDLALSLYLAPVGEPALGPVAYPHRPSAAGDPFAPLGHHWQDATHITYGVVTAGAFTHAVRIEGSWFNGREPDENRTDFDYTGRRLDSYSARITINPGAQWSLAAWYGYLDSPEALAPGALHRFGASALHSRPLGARGNWSTAFVYGANAASGTGRTLGSALLETTVDADGTNAVFARLEYVKKRAEDLAVPGAASDVAYGVGAVSAGYTRELGRGYGAGVAVGARGAVSLVPAALASLYGSRSPVGAAVYLRVRPLSR